MFRRKNGMKDDAATITTQLETSGNSFEWLIEKKQITNI